MSTAQQDKHKVRCNIVCKGKLLPGTSVDNAKEKLALHFKTTPPMLDGMFSGRTVTLKRNVDLSSAKKIKSVAARCGVVFEIQPVSAPKKQHSPANKPQNTKAAPRPIKAPSKKSGLFRKIRIAALSLILCLVATNAWLQRLDATDWKEPLNVVIYPMAGQDNPTVANYLASIETTRFDPISTYFSEEAEAYELNIGQPFAFYLGPQINGMPPELPHDRDALKMIWWSLKMRYWSYRNSPAADIEPDIKVYAIYYRAIKGDLRENSIGLQKGMFSIVHVYAHRLAEKKNNVIIAHEILHTVGATDKYDIQTHRPIYPDGYADPDQNPRYPQKMAEIMAARIPQSPTKVAMPPDLDHCLIGYKTALEIKWIQE